MLKSHLLSGRIWKNTALKESQSETMEIDTVEASLPVGVVSIFYVATAALLYETQEGNLRNNFPNT